MTSLYDRTVALLKPVMERVASDADFRDRFEASPLQIFDELGVPLDAETRQDLEGKRFSEFWAARRQAIEGPVQVRDLPPPEGALDDQQLDQVHGGRLDISLSSGLKPIGLKPIGPPLNFAPPYVPVGG